MIIIKPKKGEKPVLTVIGGNSEGVTGSCTQIEYNKHLYLFEFGAIQNGRTPLETYKLNRKQIQKVKSKQVEVIIISHCHHDHQGLIPALYKLGCTARILVPKKSTEILKEMWRDSCYINQRDSLYISKKTGNTCEPLYSEEDVMTALSFVEEIDSHEIVSIDNDLSIRYIPAGHIFLSRQCEVYLGTSHKYKVLFTGDLGNLRTQDIKFYMDKFEPVNTSGVVIGECTYGLKTREVSKDTLNTDLQKIKTVIEHYCLEISGRVLIPTFALDKTLYMLSVLYDLLGENCKIPIIVDSPLAIRLLKIYGKILEGDCLDRYNQILNWKSLKLIIEPQDSRAAIQDNKPKVILSASGMMTAGRSIHWTTSLLPREGDCILFCGYCGEDTLGWKIKHEKSHKTISINGKPVKNKCQIVDLTSFSSHMQYRDLLNYYKSIHCDKIYLVHGDMESKISFKADLEQEIHNSLRTTKVIATNRSTKIIL